jgi:cation transport regulator ChaC
VFGYGSLIYKVDFPFYERQAGHILGWERRFWQGSHDHRGTPDAPGRVVTLVEVPGQPCYGMAYCVAEEVFEHLDHREKNGYVRVDTSMHLADGREVPGTVYIADAENHAFLGPDTMGNMANHIASSHGPSGSNREYLLTLARALRELNIYDDHVFELEALLQGS